MYVQYPSSTFVIKPTINSNSSTQAAQSTSSPPVMPPHLNNVIPANAPNLTAAGKKPPAGVLPIAVDPNTGKVLALLGYETGNVVGFTDFGGSGDPTDISREHTAIREFMEEACLVFFRDVARTIPNPPKLNVANAFRQQIEDTAANSLLSRSTDITPWFYASRIKYLTCLLPVGYQSTTAIRKQVDLVRNKHTLLHPFYEKTDFIWIPLEDLISWIEKGIDTPNIPGKPGKPIS